MRDTPESLPYGDYLPDVYRFAFLMTGRADIAADVLRHTVARAARHGINGMRNPLQAKRWLFAEARTLCAQPPPPAPRGDVPGNPAASPAPAAPGIDVPALPDNPPRQLATLFADLPADERGALILFYLFLFDPAELADLLEIKPAALGPLLLRGRTLLQRHGSLCENLFAAVTSTVPDGTVAAEENSAPVSANANTEAVPGAA